MFPLFDQVYLLDSPCGVEQDYPDGMPNGFKTLQDMIQSMDQQGEVLRIRDVVSPILQIAAIADLHSKSMAPRVSEAAIKFDPDHADRGGKALVFENVEGSDFPLVINLFGSYTRMEQALGCRDGLGFTGIANTLENITAPRPPAGIRDILSRLNSIRPILKADSLRRKGPCRSGSPE